MIILHTVTRGSGGGTMRSLKQAIDFERSLGNQVWICSGNIGNQDKGHIYIPALVRRINPYSDIRAAIQLNRAIRAVNPDVIHSHESKAGILTRLLSFKFKKIVFVHTVHMATFHSQENNLIQHIYSYLEKLMARKTEFLIFVSPGLKQIYEKMNISAKTGSLVLRSRVDLEVFRARSSSRIEDRYYLRNLLQLDENSLCIIHVGLLEERKRPEFILKSLADLIKSQKLVHLLFVGDGPMLTRLQSLASSLGVSEKVHFVGFVDDPDLWMSGSDILVLASKFEGFPQVAIQAAAVGLPVIATDLEEYQGSGFIQQLSPEESMGDKIEEVLKQNRLAYREFEEELSGWNSDSINRKHEILLNDIYTLTMRAN